MRAIVRSAFLLLLCVVLAAPASAAQIIRYKGRTSAPSYNNVKARVTKEANGERVLDRFEMRVRLTCEDLTTEEWRVGIGERLAADGAIHFEFFYESTYLFIDGSIRWGKGSGTAKFSHAILTSDHQDAQLCTSGDLTWTIDRVIEGVGGAPRSAAVPDGVGVLRLRVRHGVVEVVMFAEP